MAAPTPEETQKQFERLQTLATTLRKDLSQFNLSSLRNDAALVGELLEKWERELDDSLQSIDSISSSFKSVVSEISKGNRGLSDAQSSFRRLTSLAQDLQTHNSGITKLSTDQLKLIEKQALKEKLKLQTTLDTLEADKQTIINDRKNGIQNAHQLEQLRKIKAAQNEIKGTIEGQNQAFEDLIINARDLTEKSKNINDALGLGGNATKGIQDAMSKMGLGRLSENLDMEGATSAMSDMASQLTSNGKNVASLGSKFKIAGAGGKAAFAGMASSLAKSGPQIIITELIEALQIADNAAGQLAKDFNVTYVEANATRRELGMMAANSAELALNTKNLQESMVAVGKSLGTNAMLNKEDLATFTKLREQAGYTNEELIGIQKLSLVNNKTLKENTAEILGGAEAYAARNGFVVNEKDILREVSNASASLKLTLGGSAEAVAVAATKAKQFGLNLEQAEKISNSLLQFESSIENELSAELLTGKDLNFEKARTLALNGDIAGASAEIAKQVGTSADFAKMNVIQQEAIAKAAGLTRDELAQSLMDKEALNKLSAKEGETSQQAFNRLVKEVGMEEAKKRLGNEQLANQFAQQSVQERFAQSTEKLKEVFIQIAEPILAIISPLAELVSTILPLINILLKPIITGFQSMGATLSSILNDNLMGIKDILGGLVEMFTGDFTKGLKKMSNGILRIVLNPFQAILTGIITTINGTIDLLNMIPGVKMSPIEPPNLLEMVQGDDVLSPGQNTSGYGKRTLFGPEGAISLNDKDTVIAGTDLFQKGNDVISPSITTRPTPGKENKPSDSKKDPIVVSNKTAPKKEIKQTQPDYGDKFDRLIAAMNKRNEAAVLIQ